MFRVYISCRMSDVDTTIKSTDKPSAALGCRHYLLLGLIILLGIGLRFFMLDSPALWGDEAATWARTAGTFKQMLEGNRGDGFVPLNYELYWAMGQVMDLTPWRMRLVPAITGVLMIPAMYLLGRQLLKPNGALLLALLTATSAYFLNYSRDAKMYMQTWLFVTLHIACLLWWLRGGGGIAWWSWVGSGVAAVGFHSTAWLAVPIGALALLTHGRPRLGRLIFYPVGIAIMAAGPLFFYETYNTWAEQSGGIGPLQESAEGDWEQSGISWIDPQTRHKTGPELVRDSDSAFLIGYSRAEETRVASEIVIPPMVLNIAWSAFTAMLVIMVARLVKLPARAAPSDDPQTGPPPFAGWRRLLWLSAWIVLPTYALFYCRSVSDPVSPVQWVKAGAGYFDWHWLWIIPVFLLLCIPAVRYPRARQALAWVLGIWIITLIIAAVAHQQFQWYLTLMQYIAHPVLLGALLCVGCAVSFAAAGETLRQRLGKVFAGVIVTAIVLGLGQAGWHYWDNQHRIAQAAGMTLQSIWMPRYLGIITPAVFVVLTILVLRLPGRFLPVLATVLIVSINLTQYGARLYMDPEPRVDLMAEEVFRGSKDPELRVYLRERFPMGSPGTGTFNDLVGRYYLGLLLGQSNFDAGTIRHTYTDSMLPGGVNRMHSVRWVINDIQRHNQVQTVVIWARNTTLNPAEIDELISGLDQWELTARQDFPAWRHWNWQRTDTLFRFEFRRITPTPPL